MLAKRTLGRTGFEVTEFGLRAWPLGSTGKVPHYGDVSEEDAIAVLEAYVDAGGNFIDTARGYNDAERRIGIFLERRGRRDDLFIATKTVAGTTSDTVPNIRKDLETSLELLQTSYVDLFMLHQPPEDPEVMNLDLYELLQLKNEGKIRSIGASIKGGDVNDATESMCRQYLATGKVEVIQLIYSILRQRHAKVIEEAAARGVGIIARTALESGLLTGKYKPGQTFKAPDHRFRYKADNLDFVLQAARDIAEFAVQPPYEALAQVAMRFSLAPQGVSTLIVGAHRAASVNANMTVADLPPLDSVLLEKLKEKYGDATTRANFV